MRNFYSEINDLADDCKKIVSILDCKSNEELVEILQTTTSDYIYEEAQNALIKKNVGYCITEAAKACTKCYVPYAVGGNDILEVAIGAMLDSAKKFTLSKNNKLTTYARKRILGAVVEYVNGIIFPDVSDKTARKYLKAVKIKKNCVAKGITDIRDIIDAVKAELDIKKDKTAYEYIVFGERGLGQALARSYDEMEEFISSVECMEMEVV